MSTSDIAAIGRRIKTPLTFFGHTHLQCGFQIASSGVKRIDTRRALELKPDFKYIVNPGSVGRPRDGDPRAAYAVYSPEDRAVQLRRVAYGVAAAGGKIQTAGLPGFFASRRAVGNLVQIASPRPQLREPHPGFSQF